MFEEGTTRKEVRRNHFLYAARQTSNLADRMIEMPIESEDRLRAQSFSYHFDVAKQTGIKKDIEGS